MSDFRMDEDEELVLVDGDLVLITGNEEVAQDLRHRLKAFKGEWFLNQDDGVPYYQDILGKGKNPSTIGSVLRRAIMETPGVKRIKAFALDLDKATRRLSVNFTVSAEDGDFALNLEL